LSWTAPGHEGGSLTAGLSDRGAPDGVGEGEAVPDGRRLWRREIFSGREIGSVLGWTGEAIVVQGCFRNNAWWRWELLNAKILLEGSRLTVTHDSIEYVKVKCLLLQLIWFFIRLLLKGSSGIQNFKP
jgi:hypothetical protein